MRILLITALLLALSACHSDLDDTFAGTNQDQIVVRY